MAYTIVLQVCDSSYGVFGEIQDPQILVLRREADEKVQCLHCDMKQTFSRFSMRSIFCPRRSNSYTFEVISHAEAGGEGHTPCRHRILFRTQHKYDVTMEIRHPVNNSALFKNHDLDTKHIHCSLVNQLSQVSRSMEPAKVERASTWSDVVEEGIKLVHLVIEVLSSPNYFSARGGKNRARDYHRGVSYINNL